MNIGEKIRKLRTEKMMTQSELSGDQVTRNMLSLIEKGKAVPSLQTLAYIASRLNVSTAFLLADDSEEQMLKKCTEIANVRLAFKNRNYRICMDLCKKLDADDEIKLIMAESALAVAKEEVYNDRVRSAWALLDEAVLYSSETAYSTKHIEAMAGILFEYLGELSPSLVADNMDVDSFDFESAKSFCADDELCGYIIAIKSQPVSESAVQTVDTDAYDRHVECKRLMLDGEYEKAHSILNDILRIDERLPGVVLYHIFNDLEECCINLGNPKNARMYSAEKVSQLERILN